MPSPLVSECPTHADRFAPSTNVVYFFIALGPGCIMDAARRVLWPNAQNHWLNVAFAGRPLWSFGSLAPPKKMDFAPIDNTGLTANGEKRTENG